MADDLFSSVYNPDVLSCLANLSNDEVFTPPDVVNKMLDMLPQELFRNPDTTFLDPACKTGVFLREIAKRLITGLEPQIPDLQERIDHIFHKQLYAIAITELTSLLSRRGVYCSKYPNSEFSVTQFDDAEGNIRYRNVKHSWVNGKCKYCGTTQNTVLGGSERGQTLESHAYEWIHTLKPEEIFKMKFDVIISNPPYQLSTSNVSAQAIPLYDKFIIQAKKLQPRYMTMIIPARWFSGGMGMDSFRESMLSDRKIRFLTDYPNAKDCFSGLSISGGVCYFLWDRDNPGQCQYTNVFSQQNVTLMRDLDEYDTLVRYNQAVSIIHKIYSFREKSLSLSVSSISPFGISTKERGTQIESSYNNVRLFHSSGVGYIPRAQITKENEYLNKYKVLVSQTSAEHAGEPGKDGMYRVLTNTLRVLKPNEACTHSYIVIGPYTNNEVANNVLIYLKTKFVRFLLLQHMSSIHLTKSTFTFVPTQDFSKPWTDEELYAKYGITEEEIAFIDSMIRPMDLSGGDTDAD